MTEKRGQRFTVISNSKVEIEENLTRPIGSSSELRSDTSYQTNPLYQKLLNFRNLQREQKKRFSVDDLFKLC